MISEQTELKMVTLTARSGSGTVQHYQLDPDKGTFVGKSSNCGLQLRGDGLSDIHCHVCLEGGKLWVQDWMSEDGTRVNGEAISSKVEVKLGGVIQIGLHRIEVSDSPPAARCDADQDTGDGQREPVVEEEPAAESIVEEEPVQELDHSQSPTSSLGDSQPKGDSECLSQPSGRLPQERDADTEESESTGFDDDFFEFEEDETYDRETVALLQAEIEELQTALAQRDAARARAVRAHRQRPVLECEHDPHPVERTHRARHGARLR
jgi:pSer/pThr/pTyr-binding forkhead associated (FHA) protein